MKLKILKFESYLKTIKNSVGSKIFRTCYVTDGRKKFDVYKNGEVSCAFFVSGILLLFKLIDRPHATVKTTIEKMNQKGWKRRRNSRPKPGDIIIWEKMLHGNNKMHQHIGFYINNNKAVSNCFKKRTPKMHHYKYGGKRKIVTAYYWPSFNN